MFLSSSTIPVHTSSPKSPLSTSSSCSFQLAPKSHPQILQQRKQCVSQGVVPCAFGSDNGLYPKRGGRNANWRSAQDAADEPIFDGLRRHAAAQEEATTRETEASISDGHDTVDDTLYASSDRPSSSYGTRTSRASGYSPLRGYSPSTASRSSAAADPVIKAASSKSAPMQSSDQEVMVSKALLDSLTSNLRSIQVARSSWALKVKELQADMDRKNKQHEATERMLRDAQLEKRSLTLRLQEAEDALAQQQELQQQQLALLTSLQDKQKQQQQEALIAEGWLDADGVQPQEVVVGGELEFGRQAELHQELQLELENDEYTANQAPVSTSPVTISIRKETRPGENIYVVGNQPILGSWVPKDAFKLKWTTGHVWTRTLDIPQDVEVCFKMVELRDNGESNWESGGDRKFTVAPGATNGLNVVCEWDRTNKTQISPSK